MKEKPAVTVAILTYNNETNIAPLIDSIESQTYKEIVILVVDNSSSDKTCDVVELKQQSYKNIILLKNKENLGYNKGKNLAVEAAKTDYVYLLDGDIQLTNQNTILELKSFYENTDDIAFCSIPMRNADEDLVAHTGCFFSWYGQRLNQELNISALRALKYYKTGAPIGGNIFFRKQVWHILGGYINIQPFNFDDYYIGALSSILGYKNYIYTCIIAKHIGNGRNTLPSFSKKFRYFLSGNLFLINIIYINNIRYSFLAAIFIFVKAIKNSFKFRSIQPLGDYFFSAVYFSRNLNFVLEMRKKVQKDRKLSKDVFLQIQLPKQIQ